MPLAVKSSLALNTGENNGQGIIIDDVNGYAYELCYLSPAQIVKIRLSDNTRIAALTLNSGENLTRGGVIDTTNGFLYVACVTSPTRIVKIRLSDFTRVGALTLDTGENSVVAGAIDIANDISYWSVSTIPGIVVKVNNNGTGVPTRTGALTLEAGDAGIRSIFIDTANANLYVCTVVASTPARIVKISTATFTRTGALNLNTNENGGGGWQVFAFDAANGIAYVATYSATGGTAAVVKINLSSFTRVGALTWALGTGEGIYALALNAADGMLYVMGQSASPSNITRILTSDFTVQEVNALPAGYFSYVLQYSTSTKDLFTITTATPALSVQIVGFVGSGAITEEDDVVAGTGTFIPREGAGAIIEEDDVVAGTGTHYPPNVGVGAIIEADDVVSGTGDSGTLIGTGAITEADDVVSGAGALKNIGTAAYTDENDTAVGTGTLPIDVVEAWSLNVSHPLTQMPLAGLGNAVVKFEAYKESSGDWFNSATSALQVAKPTPLALLEDVSGNHAARYAANATITVFNQWMILHWYYDYDASDGRGSVRYHSWVRAYYNDGVQILPGLTAAQAFQLAEKPILSQIVGALPDAPAIAAATVAASDAGTIDGAITRIEKERLQLAETLGHGNVPAGAGTYAFKAQDGTTTRIGGTVDANGVRTVTTVNGAP